MQPSLVRLIIVIMWFASSLQVGAVDIDSIPRPSMALQNAWDEMMLNGTFGWIADGKTIDIRRNTNAKRPGWSWIHGSRNDGFEIRVSDLRERRFIKSRGGWILEGGLLGQLGFGDDRIELYGKTITRHEPSMTIILHAEIGGETWNLAHEFFLLQRRNSHDRARILKKWIVADAAGDIHKLLPRASLERESGSPSFIVRVMNAHEAGLFIERLDITKLVGK